MRYIFFLISLIVGVSVFAIFINPQWGTIQTLRGQIAQDTDRLNTAQKLKDSRDVLINKYNSISKSDLDNIKTLLPDNVNNIRLIIQVDSLAQKNNLSTLKNVTYKATDDTTNQSSVVFTKNQASLPYNPFVITFGTSGQYKNFLNFMSDLEENLRLIDITDVSFAPTPNQNGNISSLASMNYKVSLKTYWLTQ